MGHVFPGNNIPLPPDTTISLCDANWGPQDQSLPNPNKTEYVDLFKSCSISGFIIWMGGPLHWVSKHQSSTARSSTEAEIYATDECVKSLQHISHIIQDLHLSHLLPPTFNIYNDNEACVKWSYNKTTKGLRHLQMRENSTREQQLLNFCKVRHINGRCNISDLFTKEDKDNQHYIAIRDTIQSPSGRRVRIVTYNPIHALRLCSMILVLACSLSSVGGST